MDEKTKEILKTVFETEVDEESKLEELLEKAQLSEKGQNAVKAALRLLTAYKDELPSDVLEKLRKAGGFPAPESKAKGEGEENPFAKPDEEDAMKKKNVEKNDELSPEIQEKMDAVLKARDDEISALKAQNEAIEKSLKEEKDQRDLETWVRKAEADLEHVPGKTADELGRTLKNLADNDPELAKEHFEQLKTISKQMEESAMFGEIGGGGSKTVEGSAWDEILKMADGVVEKSGMEKTQEQAVAHVLKSAKGAELYEKYLKEHPAQC